MSRTRKEYESNPVAFENYNKMKKNIEIRTRVFHRSKVFKVTNPVVKTDKANKRVSVHTNYKAMKSNVLLLNNRFAPLCDLEEDKDPTNSMNAGVNTKQLMQGDLDRNKQTSLVAGSNPNRDNNNLNSSTNTKDTVKVVNTVLQGRGKAIMNKVNVYELGDKCSDLKQCINQQTNAFGFLPITNLKRLKIGQNLKPNKILSYEEFDPVAVHNSVRATGQYNFEKAKIQLPSAINFKLFEELCEGHWDYQLPYFIKFGFPLDFPHNLEHKLQYTGENHNSAVNFPEHVDTYLKTEQEHQAIYGPYTEPPYGKYTQVSPYMSREKTDSENRRIIIDLSWPRGASINTFTPPNVYLNTVYKLQYPTIDNITEALTSLGEGAYLYKIDLSRAFRQLRIDPRDYNLLCLKWGDSYYSDVFCPFGHRAGSMACTRLSDYFRHIMRQENFTIFNYVDDLMGIGPLSTVHNAYTFLLDLLEKLGFPISTSKLEPPSTTGNCLGVIVNTVTSTLSVPTKKLAEILNKCNCVHSQKYLTKRELQSIIGSLMFIAKCVKPTRFFVNRLLEALRKATNGKYIPVTESIKRDLNWFKNFLPKFNGTAKYIHNDVTQVETLAIDACLQGVGGVWQNRIYTAPLPNALKNDRDFNITHYEMINIIVALRLWGAEWSHQKVLLKTDNIAVVSICNTGYTRDQHLARMVRNIWLLTAEHDICLQVAHIAGKQNTIADLLSRWEGTPTQIEKIHEYTDKPRWYKVQELHFQLNIHI